MVGIYNFVGEGVNACGRNSHPSMVQFPSWPSVRCSQGDLVLHHLFKSFPAAGSKVDAWALTEYFALRVSGVCTCLTHSVGTKAQLLIRVNCYNEIQ